MSLRCFQAEVLLPWEQEFPSQSSSCVLFEFFFLKMVFFSIFPWEMSTRLLRVNLVCVCVCVCLGRVVNGMEKDPPLIGWALDGYCFTSHCITQFSRQS